MNNKILFIVIIFIFLTIMCIGIELEKASVAIFGGVPFVFLLMFGPPFVFFKNPYEE